MADPTQGQDPSMEDILASIRRIIDEDERKAPGGTLPDEAASAGDDDVLDLTEAVDDPAHEGAGVVEGDAWSGDDEVLPDDAEVIEPTAEPEPYIPSTPFQTYEAPAATPPAAAPQPAAASHEDRMTASNDERLVSEAAYSSAAAALGSLARASERDPLDGVPRGRPVEELVMELLKPMLREWLDENLPTIVERVVEREVRYLSRRAEGGDRT